ncbi:hypothetical protein EVAR_98642_1 [Eumeta japonica]|uniref:Uncharacterized protein n=1 Tax=Eumeta variegata TaxID=151549 RepID=A0A4C1XVJ2_EUMVA|nr:hypothetical protein EVAR_98642_1 [Eumeta japonica]
MEDAASMDETANNKRDKHQGVSATNIAPRGNRGVRLRGHYHNNVHPPGGQERRGFRPSSKFRKAKHGVDRLRIILDNQELISRLENI